MGTVTPNMDLNLPTVGVTVGPTWASMLNTALTAVDAHDHTTGKGVAITPSAININSNLDFNAYYASDLGAASLTNQSAAVTTDGSLYQYLTNLFFRDGSSNTIQITDSGNLNVAAIATHAITTTKIGSGVASSGTPMVADGSGGTQFSSIAFSVAIATKTSNYQLTSADGTILANASSSSFRITMPNPSANTGKIFFLKMIGTNNGFVVTIKAFGSETFDGASSMTLQVPNESFGLQTDGTNWYQLF